MLSLDLWAGIYNTVMTSIKALQKNLTNNDINHENKMQYSLTCLMNTTITTYAKALVKQELEK